MDRISEMPPAFESGNTQLLREFPKEKNEDLNTDRVENFIRQEGLEIKPYIIFDRKDLPRVREIVDSAGLFGSVFNNDEEALYSPEMDMIFIARNRSFEESSGVIYTEGLLVHELAHASNVTVNYKRLYSPRVRVGFCTPRNQTAWGWLLEEGWADMHRAKYFAQNASEGEKQKLEDALGFGEIGMEDTIPITTFPGEILPLPFKYLSITPDGKPTALSSAYAGYTLELLCRRDLVIKKLLIEGRGSVKGLRKLAKAFEKIMPGLYEELQCTYCSKRGFSETLSMVITNVAGGMDRSVRAQGLLRSTWNNLLYK